MRWEYFKGCIDDDGLLIRDGTDNKNGIIQRFDFSSNSWVKDWNMCGIFSGDILALPISEEEALRIIENGQQ